jgi:hypothetical protein
MPAKAGIQPSSRRKPGTRKYWTPAFAGVTTFYEFINFQKIVNMRQLRKKAAASGLFT